MTDLNYMFFCRSTVSICAMDIKPIARSPSPACNNNSSSNDTGESGSDSSSSSDDTTEESVPAKKGKSTSGIGYLILSSTFEFLYNKYLEIYYIFSLLRY